MNFANGHGRSRLSNLKIIQWYNIEMREVMVYEPDYESNARAASCSG